MKKIILIGVIIITLCNRGFTQDIHFSQFYQTPLIINPALTGSFNGQIRVLMNYKDQWGSVVENPYKTYALSYDMSLMKKKWENSYLGAGFYAFNDKAGNSDFGVTQFNLSLSGIVMLSKSQIVSAGLQGGFAQQSINYADLKWGKYYEHNNDPTYNTDPVLASGMSNNYSFGDFSAGVSWKFAKEETNITSNDQFVANVGVALFHLNKPKQEFFTGNTDDLERLYSKLVVHGGTYIGIKNSNINLLPSVLFLMQGPSTEIDLGCMVRYTLREESRYTGLLKETAILIGGYFRVGDAIIPSVMFEIANFAVGVSYDVNISGLKSVTTGRGGVEISLRYISPNPFRYGKGTRGTPML